MTSEQRYYLNQNIRNPNITLNQIAKKLNVDRTEINFYLVKYYKIFEPYIKMRKELTG